MIRAAFASAAATPATSACTAALDGGALMDVGCYCVSGCRTLAAPSPRALGAVAGGDGVDVALAATLRFPSDVLAHFDCGLT